MASARLDSKAPPLHARYQRAIRIKAESEKNPKRDKADWRSRRIETA
jgi:hypothetical protein